MQKINQKIQWKLGIRVLTGFFVIFSAIWAVQLIFGLGPNLVLKQIGASQNVRVFIGTTINRLGVLAAIIVFSDLGLRKVLGASLKTAG